MQVGIITNPNANKNAHNLKRQDTLARLVGAGGVVRQTRTLDDLRPALAEFVDLGARYWVSDGGDGTFHWMLNEGREILEERALWDRSVPQLVPTNGGTIDFVAKKAGIKGKADAIIGALMAHIDSGKQPATVTMDTLEVRGHRPGDPPDAFPFRKLGFAVAIGGIGQRFFSKYYSEPVRGPWTILKVITKAMVGYWGSLPLVRRLPIVPQDLQRYGQDLLAGTRARVIADGHEFPYERYQGLHAGAVDVDFGTVKLFRYAEQPGKLHLVVGAMDRIECTYRWIFLVLGLPVAGKTWHEFPGELLDVESCHDELFDPVIDGEMFHGFDRLQVRLGAKIKVPVLVA